MSRFGEPDAEWTDDYPWTRYRGPQPYPCPGDWVLGAPEMLAYGWYFYPDIGRQNETDNDVADAFGQNYDGYNDALEGRAFLIAEDTADSIREETISWRLSIDGEDVFERVEPDSEDLWATVAEILQRYSDGVDYDDLAPESGRLTQAERREQQLEARKESNQSLGDFA